MVNGGGIRTNIECGEVLFNDLYNAMPLGDMVLTCTLTGQQLLDILEFSVSSLSAENGVFMQVSGLRFDVDPSTPSPVVRNAETNYFSHIANAQRRVSNLQIFDKESGTFKNIELSHRYTMASLDYLILEAGGSGIMQGVEPDNTYRGADIEVLRYYLEVNLNGNIGNGYKLPQGRINIR